MLPLGPKRRDDDVLTFESKFESGNLSRAERIGPSEYVLYIREDINLVPINGRDKCYNQWFFFRVDGMQEMRPYTFHICNMYKAKSLFQVGMHVHLRSPESDLWFPGGSDFIYKESTFSKKGTKIMYQLTFRLCSPHSSLYVAAAQPYTYSDLCTAMSKWQGQQERALFIKRHTLCKTLAGNPLEFLIISDPLTDRTFTISTSSRLSPSELPEDQRPWIIVCGRVHPSESNSSWFVHGLIEFLTDPQNSVAAQLRRQFVWLVVPMINPDGVICGNSRCNLAGLDLNRCWANPLESTCPTIFHTKALLQCLCPLVTISLFLDVHGHSRKRGAFFYGNRRQQRSATGQLMPYISAPVGHEVRVPQLLAKFSSIFSLQDCTYTITRNKMGTARYVVFNEFQLINSYTLEISMFAASSLGDVPSSETLLQASESHDAVSRSLNIRDAIKRIHLDAETDNDKNVICQIPRHFETGDFMQLSRDFATCLISDLSWISDPNGEIYRMKMSPDSPVIYTVNLKDHKSILNQVNTPAPSEFFEQQHDIKADFLFLAGVQRRFNDALEILKSEHGPLEHGRASVVAAVSQEILETEDLQVAKQEAKVTIDSMQSSQPSNVSLAVKRRPASVVSAISQDTCSSQKATASTVHVGMAVPVGMVAPSESPLQQIDGFVKPWSLSLFTLDATINAHPTPSPDACPHLSGRFPFGSRMRSVLMFML